eukprot:TRINITY_DN74158_c0_g1_i1.p1 TRINITY_DN74158_c0_g1~~TRINITY_DN74158_c0_g1_i1.p1  ORF type:complete len:244 (+),score=39.05 TRINITY_DN74158_c0_g1_i1:47-733(+)
MAFANIWHAGGSWELVPPGEEYLRGGRCGGLPRSCCEPNAVLFGGEERCWDLPADVYSIQRCCRRRHVDLALRPPPSTVLAWTADATADAAAAGASAPGDAEVAAWPPGDRAGDRGGSIAAPTSAVALKPHAPGRWRCIPYGPDQLRRLCLQGRCTATVPSFDRDGNGSGLKAEAGQRDLGVEIAAHAHGERVAVQDAFSRSAFGSVQCYDLGALRRASAGALGVHPG